MSQSQKKVITQDKVVYFINYILLAILLVVVLYPIIYIVSCSFSSGDALMTGKVKFLPAEPTLQSYKAVFKYQSIWTGYRNSIIYAVVGTVISMVLTLLAAYPLSREDFRGKKIFMVIVLFTMMFNGGLVPTFIQIRNLKMLNTIWAVILPSALSAYNIIIMRTSFAGIPEEMLEAARIDGAGHTRILLQIVLPVSKAIIMVIVLFYGVLHWNEWFNAAIYLPQARSKFPLQLVLREIVLLSSENSIVADADGQDVMIYRPLIKYATIMVSVIPMMALYPFVQRYFVSGVMIGSVKG